MEFIREGKETVQSWRPRTIDVCERRPEGRRRSSLGLLMVGLCVKDCVRD